MLNFSFSKPKVQLVSYIRIDIKIPATRKTLSHQSWVTNVPTEYQHVTQRWKNQQMLQHNSFFWKFITFATDIGIANLLTTFPTKLQSMVDRLVPGIYVFKLAHCHRIFAAIFKQGKMYDRFVDWTFNIFPFSLCWWGMFRNIQIKSQHSLYFI